MVILTDTNIIIDFIRQKDRSETLFDAFFYIDQHKPVIALTTVSELWAGKSMTKNETVQIVQNLLEKIDKVNFTVEVAQQAGELLRKYAETLSFSDAEIAAHALYYNLPLLTLNKKDFKQIKGLRLV